MKKKPFALLLVIALLCVLCACGGQETPEETSVDQEEPSQAEGGTMPENSVSDGDVELPEEDAAPEADAPDEGTENPAPAEEETPENPPEQPAAASAPETSKPAETPVLNPETPSAQTEKPAEPDPTPAPAPTPPPEPEPEPEPEPAPAPAADPKAVAQGLVGRPVSELYAAIGRPLASDYAPSCLDLDGEDGELTYDGFVVYTTRGADYETVYAVF